MKVVKLDGKPVDEDTLNTVFVFFLCFMGVLGLACLVVCLDGFSTTSFTATLACLSNTGPGLEAVGPMGNFSAFSALSKWVLSAAMLIGRLEIFPILILFAPPPPGGRIECRPPPADSCESAGFFFAKAFWPFCQFLEKGFLA